jgi:hypothetical protein
MVNVKLFVAHDPAAPYDKAVHALTFRQVKNLKLRNIEVIWDKPEYDQWKSALYLEDIQGLELEGFQGRQAKEGADDAAVVLNQVENAQILQSKALAGTSVFCEIRGEGSRGIYLLGNDLLQAKIPYRIAPGVKADEVKARNNLLAEK